MQQRGSVLHRLLVEKLGSSALKSNHIKALALRAYTKQESKELDIPFAGDGFIIPYFTEEGRTADFFRYRFFQDPRSEWKKLTEGRPIRYVQPPDTVPEVYLCPLAPKAWTKILPDPAQPIIITEGELKAASINYNIKVPAVGLGGVWSWKSKKHDIQYLDWFREVAWKDRTVYIVFDSDAVEKPEVVMAESALAHLLTDFGAKVYITRIPQKGSKKLGADDYILQYGAAKFKSILDKSTEFAESKELHALNSRVIYVRDPGLIFEIETCRRVSVDVFMRHLYAPWTYKITEGKKSVEKSAPVEWMKWSQRNEVKSVDFQPGGSVILPNGNVNTWRGWGCEPKRGNMSLWHELMDFLFSNEGEEAKIWFERWLAYPLQFPGTKLYSASLLWGNEHGTGKSLVGYCMQKIYGESFEEIGEEELHATYNEWAENKLFAMGEEITGGDKRRVADKMKRMITRKSIRLNPKYIPSYNAPDRINYYLTSNHCDSLFIEDKDRRYFVVEVPDKPIPGDFYNRFDTWLNEGDLGPNLFHYLLNLDLGTFSPTEHAFKTRAKSEMISSGRSDLGDWVAQLKESPKHILNGDDRVLWRNMDLIKFYDSEGKTKVTPNGLGRELKRAGMKQASGGMPVNTAACGMSRFWVIGESDKDFVNMGPREVARYYDAMMKKRDSQQKKRKFK